MCHGRMPVKGALMMKNCAICQKKQFTSLIFFSVTQAFCPKQKNKNTQNLFSSSFEIIKSIECPDDLCIATYSVL